MIAMEGELAIIVFAGAASVAYVFTSLAYGAALRRSAGAAVQTAGIYKFTTPAALARLRFVFAIAFAAAAVAVLAEAGIFSLWAYATIPGAAAWLGSKAPVAIYSRKAKKRKELFDAQILNLAMALSNGLMSGYAPEKALRSAADNALEPMKEELQQALNEHASGGMDLFEALERLYARLPSEDLLILITSMRLTGETGGSLSAILQKIAAMIRSRTEFQEKLKTMTAQGRFQAVSMSLAPFAVYVILRLIDPDLMRYLTSTSAGWTTIAVVAAWISIGFLIISRITKIEV